MAYLKYENCNLCLTIMPDGNKLIEYNQNIWFRYSKIILLTTCIYIFFPKPDFSYKLKNFNIACTV